MRLAFLLVASIPPSILAFILNPRSLVDGILFNLPRSNGLKWVESFLANFCPARDALSVSLMLQYRRFPYQKIYESIEESPERQIQLFENLFNPTNENNSHETFFSPGKLQRNLILAKRILFEVESIAYKGRFFAPGLNFAFDDVYRKNKELVMAILHLCIKEQMGMMSDSAWLVRFLGVADEGDVHKIFKLLLDCREMTPRIFGCFVYHWKRTKRKSLVDEYFHPDLVLPRGELLMRCALLLSSRYLSRDYAECKGFDLNYDLDKLQKVALDRGDRQSISIYFHCEADYGSDLIASEMLSYVKLGNLSPLTTERFIGWASRSNIELGDWPFEHLPRNSRRAPKEGRLSEWLCSDSLVYKDVDIITNLDNLYDHHEIVSINMRFTEPVKMEDGSVITRAADYFILTARAALDTYRGNQQTLRISVEDYRKITIGVLYALAAGWHLDFSNTELEMREDDEEWTLFKDSIEYDGRRHAKSEVQIYLDPDEIYGLVHRAEEPAGTSAELSITLNEKQVDPTISGL